MDYYKILGVENNCSETEIKQAYRTLSFKYHPDRNKEEGASDKMKDLNEAYETLSDKQKRDEYNLQLNGVHQNPFENIINELFNKQGLHNIFGQGIHFQHGNGFQNGNGFQHGNGFQQGNVFHQGIKINHNARDPVEVMFTNDIPSFFRQNVPDLEKKIEISFEDAFNGTNIPIIIEREIKTGHLTYTEEEKLYVHIIKGIDHGEILVINDKGHNINNTKGSIKLHIHILKHHTYERNGINLIYNLELSFKESICGFERIIKHIDGSDLKLLSSKGNIIQNMDKHCVKGKGITRDNNTGDLIINFKIIQPKTLTDEQIKLFESILI